VIGEETSSFSEFCAHDGMMGEVAVLRVDADLRAHTQLHNCQFYVREHNEN
jgi:hypothetical protein